MKIPHTLACWVICILFAILASSTRRSLERLALNNPTQPNTSEYEVWLRETLARERLRVLKNDFMGEASSSRPNAVAVILTKAIGWLTDTLDKIQQHLWHRWCGLSTGVTDTNHLSPLAHVRDFGEQWLHITLATTVAVRNGAMTLEEAFAYVKREKASEVQSLGSQFTFDAFVSKLMDYDMLYLTENRQPTDWDLDNSEFFNRDTRAASHQSPPDTRGSTSLPGPDTIVSTRCR